MRTVGLDAQADEIRCAHFTQFLVNCKLRIGKQRERYGVGFPEIVDFEGRISGADTDDFDASFQFGRIFDAFVNLVDSGSLPLTVRSVHTENLDDDDLGLDIRNPKVSARIQPQVLSMGRIFGNR